MAYNREFTDSATLSISAGVQFHDVSRTKHRLVTGYPGCYWFLQFQRRNESPTGVVSIHVSKGPIGIYFNVICHKDSLKGNVDFLTADTHTVYVTPNYLNTIMITCNVAFRFETPSSNEGWLMHPYQLIDPSAAQNWNTELVVEEKRLKVHRGFLSMISPVFEAMFRTDTKETKTGVVEIKDMNFTTVQTAIDFCFGHDVQDKTLEELIGVHQFLDKYGIVTAINRIERCISFKTTVDNFALLVQYAWQYSHVSLQKQCGQFYYENSECLTFHPSILSLGNDLHAELVNAASECKWAVVDRALL